ncbi:hypothetical protein HB364_25915 [Pseudoflavitalea sp. X16]|uniref:tetratricopeptide repeat protein n=1 Tax=Paraflavitalea devenefica TaxID=2716334 RepID=UPI001423C1B3|nr:hypothetical protein [Paraflavitalea devenefica]NII28546.1 hypothetical protein [Paraflavitalea devenefica]
MNAVNRNFLFLLLLFTGQLYGQPGGGGGLIINNLYNDKLDKIDLLTDTSLKIRTFILAGEKIYQETFLYPKLLKGYSKARINGRASGFSLPSTADIDENSYSDAGSNQRMYIIYKKDTMMIDMIGIMGQNGMGFRDGIDSLVIQRGYFKYYRSKQDSNTYTNEGGHDRNSALLRNGLTLYTVKQLPANGYLEYQPGIDLSFLSDKDLPASYYLKRATYYLQNNQPEPAFADIEKGIEKNNGTKNCEILYLLSSAYTQTLEYEKAIENISLAINCKTYKWQEDWESKVQNYRTRIELFIKLGKYDKALADYSTMCAVSKGSTNANIDRANFKMKYLKDYKGAIDDLKTTIEEIPDNHLNDRPQGVSEYCDTYFTLARAEYLDGDKKSAFRHWLKAEEFGYNHSSADHPVIHFDSIISQHPKAPELYLARALAHFHRGPYLGWGDDTKNCFNNALDNINKAEELGLKDYRINMYRASVFNQLKKYNEAMKEIDRAIAKNNTDPRCFLVRYEIRDNLGQTKWGDSNDTDIKRYRMLSEHWEWEKY